jgi:hypothetical protein
MARMREKHEYEEYIVFTLKTFLWLKALSAKETDF